MISEKLNVTVHKDIDVAVCGGGIAGISAALASARQGKKTILFESQYMLGGLATAGLVTIYLPLCDGMGNQVSFGIAEELFRLSIKYGAEDRYPKNWLDNIGTRTKNDLRFEVQYNPQLFAVLAEKELVKAGVEIVYGTRVSSIKKSEDRIEYLITENKTGRLAYKVGSVVDATGDADLARFSNIPTTVFKEGNSLAAWSYSVSKSGYNLNFLGFLDIPNEEKKDGKKVELSNKKKFMGLEADELSEMTIASHSAILEDFIKSREKDETYWPVTIATTPQVRMTRKIVGEYELSHLEQHKEFDNSIGMVSNWKERGPIYEVPFTTLYNKQVKNLIFAGRCTSVDETLWDVMRVIPCCAVTGEAAGTAAALTNDFTKLDIKILQDTLRSNGVVIHEKDLKV